jgi:hypothetical protein
MYEALCLTDTFYDKLKPFDKFNEVSESKNYARLPHDWNIIITDIKGSTKAIQQGMYREVNLVGAASIVAVCKVLKKLDFPFVFGGDGATMLIPQEDTTSVLECLEDLKLLTKKNFGLDLRLGIVSMKELLDRGESIEVAKYQLTQGRTMAMMRGTGLLLADKLIKENEVKYQPLVKHKSEADLTGLTCRWMPRPSQNGKILTLLIQARDPSLHFFQDIFKQFEIIFPEGIESLNPALAPNGKYKSIWACIKDEARYQKSLFSLAFLKRLFEIIPAYFAFNLRLPIPSARRYVELTPAHCDFRKFDQVLRMVIDCSESQIKELSLFLEERYQMNSIFFGIHVTNQSIMTCFVEGLNQGEHFHFIDADEGGYVMASIQLKDQIKKASAPN